MGSGFSRRYDFTEALGDDDEYEPVEAVDHLEIDDYAYDMS